MRRGRAHVIDGAVVYQPHEVLLGVGADLGRVSGADELRDGFHVLVLDPAIDIQIRRRS